MKPLAALPPVSLRGVLFDLDDTLLTHGLLEREAYDALWDLREAGLGLLAVTGRPSGWGEVIARQWPIDAAVTENGAVTIAREGRGLRIIEECDESERATRSARLRELVREVRAAMPEVELSDDAHLRRSDVTFDIGERKELAPDRVQHLARIVRRAGARTTTSSVHLHATFDAADKASGAVRALRLLHDEDEGSALARWAFIGDSGNDRACFAAFAHTFGVENVRARLRALSVPPKWVSPSPMGRGFAEIARAILAARREQ